VSVTVLLTVNASFATSARKESWNNMVEERKMKKNEDLTRISSMSVLKHNSSSKHAAQAFPSVFGYKQHVDQVPEKFQVKTIFLER
jgi:hypothetical protein